MRRPKGGSNKFWTTEEKYKIIKPILDFEKSSMQITRDTGLSNGMICNWIKTYNERGFEGLTPKKKPGNPLSKYSQKKNLTDMEKLQYENMKLKIKNERLKKGYLVKGDGSVVSIQEIKQKEFGIVENLSKDYSVKSLCKVMNISRSGYYKWLKK